MPLFIFIVFSGLNSLVILFAAGSYYSKVKRERRVKSGNEIINNCAGLSIIYESEDYKMQ